VASEWGSRLRLKAPSLDAPIGALSGGNQQKVVIARSVMTRPRVLLMDEPTRGVDVAAKGEIIETMRRLANEGMAVVFATSELAEIHAAATRAVVMARGTITADLSGPEMTDEALASAASAAPGAEAANG
jgi:erythritol transport system ATP-binding protein